MASYFDFKALEAKLNEYKLTPPSISLFERLNLILVKPS